jgi:ankyrin repeat protein
LPKYDREGFPSEVMLDIFNLSQVYEKINSAGQLKKTDTWAHVLDKTKEELTKIGYPFTHKSLFKSIFSDDIYAVSLFLKAGIDVNHCSDNGNTPLMYAAAYNKAAVAKLLLKYDADTSAKDSQGYLPIHWSAIGGSVEITALLLAKDSDPNAQSKYLFTPLIQAATKGYIDVVELLLKNEAKVNLATSEGWTALHKAVANQHLPVVMLLLKHGANPNLLHQSNLSPIDIATQKGYTSILQELDKANTERTEPEENYSKMINYSAE